MSKKYDIAVIGAGPGGYIAAIRATQLGFKTVCIDRRQRLGGTCLNVGCIPSKALLQSTELLNTLQKHGKTLGIDCTLLKANFPQMMKRKNEVVTQLTQGIHYLFEKNKVDFIHGEAEFIDSHQLLITNEKEKIEVESQFFIIATGSESIQLPFLPFDEKQVLSSTGALSLSHIPEKLFVVGGGVIGVELASVYNRLGSKVTVIEMMDRLCPGLDLALSKSLLKSLSKQGIEFFLSSKVKSAVIHSDEVILTVEQNDTLKKHSGSAVLVAVGRKPYTKGLKLENANVGINAKGYIEVDHAFRTSQNHIFAIGDTIEGVMLAHRASVEAMAIVESIKNVYSAVNYLAIPNVIYTDPEVATVGLTEQEVDEAGIEKLVGASFFKGNSRARCMDQEEGFVKIVGDKRSGRLLGMHIIGPHASELISEGMLAIQKRATLADVARAPQAHPTLSESIKEAALDALGIALHQ